MLHCQEDLKLENEKLEGKVRHGYIRSEAADSLRVVTDRDGGAFFLSLRQVKYLEQDYALVLEKFEKEKEDHARTAHDLQVRWPAQLFDHCRASCSHSRLCRRRSARGLKRISMASTQR